MTVLQYCNTAILRLAMAGRTWRLARGHGGLDTARGRAGADPVGAGAAVGAVALET